MSNEAAVKAATEARAMRKSMGLHAQTDKAELRRRVDEVEQLLVLGARHYQIVEHAKTKWKIVGSTARDYIKLANQRLAKLSDIQSALERGKALRSYENIKQKALTPGKHKEVKIIKERDNPDSPGMITGEHIEIVEVEDAPELLVAKLAEDSKCRLLGINAAEKTEHSFTRPENMTQAERESFMAAFLLDYEKMGGDVRSMMKRAETSGTEVEKSGDSEPPVAVPNHLLSEA